jgi:hypothetical protein
MMDNDRKVYLLGLDVTKIEPNGEYYYFDKSPDSSLLYEKRCLSDQDIIFLRKYYKDQSIAYERQIIREAIRYKLAVDINKYNRKCHMEKIPDFEGDRVIVGGILVNMKRYETEEEVYRLGR